MKTSSLHEVLLQPRQQRQTKSVPAKVSSMSGVFSESLSLLSLRDLSSSLILSRRNLRNSEQSCWVPGANHGGLATGRNLEGAMADLCENNHNKGKIN